MMQFPSAEMKVDAFTRRVAAMPRCGLLVLVSSPGKSVMDPSGSGVEIHEIATNRRRSFEGHKSSVVP